LDKLGNSGWEVIVADDGAKTPAEDLIKSFYPWVKYLQGPRSGPAANRNSGAKSACGEWIVFTDDDCLPNPDWLVAFDKSKTLGNVMEGQTLAERAQRSFAEESPINSSGGKLWSCNFAIKTSMFNNLKGFDEEFPSAAMEDCDLRERLRAIGEPIIWVPDALVIHPWRPGKSWIFWESYRKAAEYFYNKHSSLRPKSFALHYAKITIIYGKNTVLRNFVKYRGRGTIHAMTHMIWLMYTSARYAIRTDS